MNTINLAQFGGMNAVRAFCKANPGKILIWDAGEGWTAEAAYCSRRKRVVFVSINSAGHRIC